MAREIDLPSPEEEAKALRKLQKQVSTRQKATKSRNKSNKSREKSVNITNKQIKALEDLFKAQQKEIKSLKRINELSKEEQNDRRNSIKANKMNLDMQFALQEAIERKRKAKEKDLALERKKIALQKEKERQLKIAKQEAQIKEQEQIAINNIEQKKKLEIAINKRAIEIDKKAIATKKKLTAQKVKNAQKIRLLIERSRAYGVELDDIKDGTNLVTRSMKGNAVAFQTLSRRMKRATKDQEKFRHHTRNVHGTLSVLRSKLLLASFAIGGITRISSSFTNASRDQELAVKRVSNAIQAQGFTSGVTTKEARNLASELQDLTGVTDELTLESSALLLSFENIGHEIFPTAQKAVLDMTSALNGGNISAETLKTQSIQLAKALDDPIKGLSSLARSGTTFNKRTKELVKTLVEQGSILEAQEVILEAVNKQYGGSASVDSFALSQRALNSAIGDLAETIGFIFAPSVKTAMDTTTSFVKSLDPDTLANFSKNFTAILTGFGSYLFVLPALNSGTRALARSFRTLNFVTSKSILGVIAKGALSVGAGFGIEKLISDLDAFSGLQERIEEAQAVDKVTEVKEELGKLNQVELIDLKNDLTILESLTKNLEKPNIEKTRDQKISEFAKNLAEGDVKIGVSLEVVKDRINKNIEQDLAFTLETTEKRFNKIVEDLGEKVFKISDATSTALIDQLGLIFEEPPRIAEAYSDLADITADINEKVFMDVDELQKNILEKSKSTLGEIKDKGIEFSKEQSELAKQALSEFKDIGIQIASEGVKALHTITMNQIGDINAIEKAELDRIKNTSEYKIATAIGDDKKIKQLEKKAREKSYEARVRKFNADQKLAYSNIAINLAQAVMNVLATYKNPITIAGLIGSYTALAGIQASAVKSQPKPDKYQYGGLVGGNLHSGGGTIIEAERGEFVMSRNAVQNFGIANMEAINNGSASPVNITFNNPVMSDDYTEDVIIPQIKRAVQRGADIGVS